MHFFFIIIIIIYQYSGRASQSTKTCVNRIINNVNILKFFYRTIETEKFMAIF